MNTYHKFLPNVFLAKCTEPQIKGSTILVTTKYGKENESIVFNLIFERDGLYYYSIIRADGFNVQDHAKRRAERLEGAAMTAEKKSNAYHEASNEGAEFLRLGEPIKIGHHSEKRHRALIERNWNRMSKAVEHGKIAESYEQRAEYWRDKENTINLSMPESIEYYEFQVEKAKQEHEDLKTGKTKKQHSYSLTYAKKYVNEAETKLKRAIQLWG